MKVKKTIKYLSGISLGLILFGACTTDVDWDKVGENFKIDQALVIPVGQASLTLEDILNNLDTAQSQYVTTEGQEIYINYTDSTKWELRDHKVSLNTTPIDVDFKPSPAMNVVVPPNNTQIFDFDHDLVLGLGINSNTSDQRFDRIRAYSAKFKVKVSKSDLDIDPANTKLTITFPNNSIEFDDKSINKIVHIPAAFDEDEFITLPPFTMTTNNSSTSIPLHFTVEISSGTTPVAVKTSSEFNFTLDMIDFDMKVAYGKFQPTISNSYQVETIDLGDFQKDIPDGIFRLSDPKIYVTAYNNVGMRLGVNLEYVKGYRVNEANYDTIYAQFKNDNPKTKVIINPAADMESIATTNYVLDKDSGQIHRLFENKLFPNKIDYKFRITNERTEGIDFITPNPKVTIKMDLKVPLRFNSGSYVQFSDSIKGIELDSILSQDYIDSAFVVLKVTNGLPVGAELNFTYLNEAGAVITTTLDKNFAIDAPVIGSNGLVDKSKLSPQQILIRVKKDQLSQLRETKKIAYTVRVDRKDTQPINFEKSNSFAVKVGLYVKGNTMIDFKKENN